MIVLVSTDGGPAQQLLVTKRSSIGAVQALLGLHVGRATSEWLIEDGTWAPADPDARLYDLAGDLQGDGSSGKKAFQVRTVADAAAPHGDAALQVAGAGASRPQPGAGSDACAPVSPKQLAEAPALNGTLPVAQQCTPADSAAAAAAGAKTPVFVSPAASEGPDIATHRGGGLQQSASQPDLRAVSRDGSSTSGGLPGIHEAVSHERLEATLPLLTGGSHIAIVDVRRSARDAMAAALLAALPQQQTAQTAEPAAFCPLQLTFDRVRPFQAGLDGFWRWVLEGLHAAAPDLFPATGLPGDASGFEEAFSADRLRTAPPVVLICSEACALAEASSWFVSRFLGTLRDMGNEQHRFFLHAVAMIGGEPLRNVDMDAYMCKMSTSLTSTLEATQQGLARRSGSRSHGSVSRRSTGSAVSGRSGGTPGGSRNSRRGDGRDQPFARVSAASGGSGGSSGRSAAAAAPAGVRRTVSGGSAIASARTVGGDGRPTLQRSSASQPGRGRTSLDGLGSLAAAEEAVLAARRARQEGGGSGAFGGTSATGGRTASGRGGQGGGDGGTAKDAERAAAGAQGEAAGDGISGEPNSPTVKPLSDKVKRLAAAFARGEGSVEIVVNGAA